MKVTKFSRREAGSCNGCTATNYLIVYQVSLPGSSFRLCPDCTKKLKAELRRLKV